ncbi:MAG: helix-turn-helix domain-containing protein [Oscillospiraceae bacterium]|nr:helix-turn-helix domain-containing protein [Oscillospiraceae bacterium]
MKNRELVPEMQGLNKVEILAREKYASTGNSMTYEEYLYVMTHPDPLPTVSELLSPWVQAEAAKLREQFRERYGTERLSAEDFINDDCPIEVEYLQRYIDIPPHRHDFVECAAVISGECRHTINGVEYVQPAGSLSFVTVGTLHKLDAVGDSFCVTMKLRADYFQSLRLPNMIHFISPVMFTCDDDPLFGELMLSLARQQREKPPYCDQLMERLFEVLFLYIMQNYQDTVQYLTSGISQNEKIISIVGYMMENYRTVTLHSLAERFHYSDAYMSRLISEALHTNFSTLLKAYKLDRAAELLHSTDLKLSDLCAEVGYSDTAQFIHSFKERFGVTPIKYRREQKS